MIGKVFLLEEMKPYITDFRSIDYSEIQTMGSREGL